MTEWINFQFSLSCIGKGNGNPFQCSCLKNPRDGGAWWAAVYGVSQSRTWLKRLSSSSSSMRNKNEIFTKNSRFQIFLKYQNKHIKLIKLLIKNNKGAKHFPQNFFFLPTLLSLSSIFSLSPELMITQQNNSIKLCTKGYTTTMYLAQGCVSS